jgi:hypothetical protein
MINGGFLGAGGEANRDNNYILDHVARLRDIPVHVVHGRYDRVCHLYQAEALVRALRDAGNNAVNYLITTAGHSSFEPETDTRLPMIMNELPPMTSPETASIQCGEMSNRLADPDELADKMSNGQSGGATFGVPGGHMTLQFTGPQSGGSPNSLFVTSPSTVFVPSERR